MWQLWHCVDECRSLCLDHLSQHWNTSFKRQLLQTPPILDLRQWGRLHSCLCWKELWAPGLRAHLGLFTRSRKTAEDQRGGSLLLPGVAPPWTSGDQNKGPLLRWSPCKLFSASCQSLGVTSLNKRGGWELVALFVGLLWAGWWWGEKKQLQSPGKSETIPTPLPPLSQEGKRLCKQIQGQTLPQLQPCTLHCFPMKRQAALQQILFPALWL